MAVQIQLRRGTAAQWTVSDPILAQGEMGVELDTGKYKIGNGIQNWNDLYYPTNMGPLSAIQDVLATDPADGAVLVYNNIINKWEATTELTKQLIDGGHF